MMVVGLTGGIGSGKTTVANMFAELGVPIIDTDQIARQLVEPGQAALAEICDQFGKDMLLPSGELNRAKLAEESFHDAKKKQQLEAILHPRIRQAMKKQLDALQSPYAIVVIPLLTETGGNRDVDRVLLVDCAEEIQTERVLARDQRPPEQLQAIIQSQASRQQRLAIADDVISNDGLLEELKAQVEQLHDEYLALSSP